MRFSLNFCFKEVFWYFLLNGNKGASATATATVLHAVTSLMLYIWKKYLFSCSSAYSLTIAAEGKALVKTDIAVAIPAGHYGRVGALQQQMREEKLYCMQPCLVWLRCPFTDLPHL